MNTSPQENTTPQENTESEFWDWTEEELRKMALQRRQDLEAYAIIFIFLIVIILKVAPA